MMEKQYKHVPLDLKDIVALGRKMYEDGQSPEEVKAWLGSYHPPVYRYTGSDEYYDFMCELCDKCQDARESGRLSHLHAVINGQTKTIQAAEEQFQTLTQRYFQVEDDTEVLRQLSIVCYETSRFFEHVIIEVFLSRQQGGLHLHENARYRINMDYFIEQLNMPGLWILPADCNAMGISELMGNLLHRLGHKVILIMESELLECDTLPSEKELLECSINGQQEYPDMTVVPAVCVRNRAGTVKNNMALLLRLLCKTHSESNYANILTTGRKFDELQMTEVKKELERLSRYEGEIFQPYMVFGRFGNYISYLERMFHKPMQPLLDREPACKFSIVIPARNSAKYLQYTIRTCLNQRYQGDYEVLVSDNSTGDNSEIWELCQSITDKRVRYIKVPKEVDAVKSFEYACLNARGEYYFSIGSDDGLLPWALEVLDEVTAKYPQEDVIRWDTGNYMWPDYKESPLFKANMVYIPQKYEKGNYGLNRCRVEDILLLSLYQPEYMYIFPSGYINSCYKKSFLREVLTETGRLHNGLCQDIYMGVVASVLKKTVLEIKYPIVVAAQSGISLGAKSNFQFDDDLEIQKNERSLLCGIAALSPIERCLPEIMMDQGLLYQAILRMVSLGCLPQELLEAIDWKAIYQIVFKQYQKEKIVYDELLNKLRYSAMNHGEEFLKWFDEEIYKPGWIKETYDGEGPAYNGFVDLVDEKGCVILTLDKYGVKNIFDAVRMFEIIAEL